jgi:hypothetical protein
MRSCRLIYNYIILVFYSSCSLFTPGYVCVCVSLYVQSFFFNHANCLESDLIDKKWPENFIIKNIKNSLLDLRAVSDHGFCCRSLTQLNSFVVVTVALLWVLLCLLLTAGAIVQCVSSVGTILWEEPRFFLTRSDYFTYGRLTCWSISQVTATL